MPGSAYRPRDAKQPCDQRVLAGRRVRGSRASSRRCWPPGLWSRALVRLVVCGGCQALGCHLVGRTHGAVGSLVGLGCVQRRAPRRYVGSLDHCRSRVLGHWAPLRGVWGPTHHASAGTRSGFRRFRPPSGLVPCQCCLSRDCPLLGRAHQRGRLLRGRACSRNCRQCLLGAMPALRPLGLALPLPLGPRPPYGVSTR